MNLSPAEVNYIAAIQKLSIQGGRVSTNALAQEFNIAPASVTDMVQKLSEKELVYYEKYKGVSLLPSGEEVANQANVSDSIWVQFFKDKLSMNEPEIEEALDHFRKVQSKTVLRKLKQFLTIHSNQKHSENGFQEKQKVEKIPASLFDQPIPAVVEEIRPKKQVKKEQNENTKSSSLNQDSSVSTFGKSNLTLSDLNKGESCYILGVEALPSDFLKLLQVHQLIIGTQVRIVNCFEFDQSIQIEINGENILLSKKITESILIERA